MKKLAFYAITLTPLLAMVTALCYGLWLTNVPQLLYARSIRNIFFDCVQFVSEDYVYKMKPGACRVKNLEYNFILTHDLDGFRNIGRAPSPDVVVIGDSFAHGIGVGDEQTFAALLSSRYHYETRNLAIGSYATMRELDVLKKYGNDATYVVLQYCSNDVSENALSLKLDKGAFRAHVEAWWRTFIATYEQGKAMGYRKPLIDFAKMMRDGTYSSKASWRKSFEARNLPAEASYVGQILARYQDLLHDKRLIILETSAWKSNSAKFEEAFRAELSRLDWLSYRMVNTAKILDDADYFFLDDHLKAGGHGKLAAAIAGEIARWEGVGPVMRHRR